MLHRDADVFETIKYTHGLQFIDLLLELYQLATSILRETPLTLLGVNRAHIYFGGEGWVCLSGS